MFKFILCLQILINSQTVFSKTLDNQKKSIIHRYFAAIDGAKDANETLKDILANDFITNSEENKGSDLKVFKPTINTNSQYHFPRVFKINSSNKITVVVHHQEWKSKKSVSNLLEYHFQFQKVKEQLKIKSVDYKFLEKAPKSISPASSVESNMWHANYYKNLK